jgi:polysaccharide pyruvyl transferase WcaK-like protein
MCYFGGNRQRADEVHASYLANMKTLVRWLVDNGRNVRLLVGDAKNDVAVAEEILGDLREYQPDLDPARAVLEPVESFAELSGAIARAGCVVAIRFHNVMGALKLAKPTISLSYSPKHDVLMRDMGLAGFSQPARSIDVGVLIEQLRELETRSEELGATLRQRNAEKRRLLQDQFAELSDVLFSGSGHRSNQGAAHSTGNPSASIPGRAPQNPGAFVKS